ncbi:MAG: hypothetical protein UU67_C0008G0035, partial [Candidatus Daviesbacteria bacterium GW2011_GWB1_41_5]
MTKLKKLLAGTAAAVVVAGTVAAIVLSTVFVRPTEIVTGPNLV